jgi:hypothetical protein
MDKKRDGFIFTQENKSVPFSHPLPAKRKYLDLQGIVPSNKKLPNGKQAGRTQSEYNEVTHFNKGT